MPPAPDALSPALEALISRYATTVRSIGARYGLTGDLVDEVVQEVRIRLWRARPGVAQLAAVGAGYMYRTAVTAALVVLRRRRTARESAELSPELEAITAASTPTPAAALEEAELATHLATAIDALDLPRQTVVRLHLKGYHRDDIAQLLGWSEAKTRNLLYRGLADLRERLAERGIVQEPA